MPTNSCTRPRTSWRGARATALAIVALSSTASSTVGQEPTMKGVWEPVSYPADLALTDVHFVSSDVGWVSGGVDSHRGGVLLHTRDGGESWEVSLGDPGSSEGSFFAIRFLDERHGWVWQLGDRLLRTTDGGASWEPVGAMSFLYSDGDYDFVSPNEGVHLRGEEVQRSTDGGRTWTTVYTCRIQTQVQGLTRQVGCKLSALHFPTSTVGYAVGRSYEVADAFALATTSDGGATWEATLVPSDGPASEVFFTDERTGYVRLDDGKVVGTRDGGATWQGVVASAGPRIVFADGEVGWSFLRHTSTLSYTMDGGRRWTTRDLELPAMVGTFALPARDRGYVVGEHGMIFRYRVVPVTASPLPGGFEGPPTPPGSRTAAEGGR